jgi:hypothetical protein
MSRVGAAEDPTMEGHDLSTTIGRGTGSASFDENGRPIYRNRNMVGFHLFTYYHLWFKNSLCLRLYFAFV